MTCTILSALLLPCAMQAGPGSMYLPRDEVFRMAFPGVLCQIPLLLIPLEATNAALVLFISGDVLPALIHHPINGRLLHPWIYKNPPSREIQTSSTPTRNLYRYRRALNPLHLLLSDHEKPPQTRRENRLCRSQGQPANTGKKMQGK